VIAGRSLVSLQGGGPLGALLRGVALVYGAGVSLRRLGYDRGLVPIERLPVPVASVGNVTVGGTGKTPTARHVAALLSAAGRRPAIVSRGYGGRHASGPGRRGIPLVVGDGRSVLASAADAGDEPVLLAGRAGVPVVVCPDRVAAGRLAIERFGADSLVLDDGFQHRRLARDLDLVLVDGRRGLGNGRLLPAGPLREPASALARAHVILLTKRAKSGTRDRFSTTEGAGILSRVRALAPRAAVFEADYRPVGLRPLAPSGGTPLPIAPAGRPLEGRRVAALSGLADPSSFHDVLARLGAREVRPLVFPDHHRYVDADLARIAAAAAEADVLVTTEKDAVKLEPTRLGDRPVQVLEVALDLDDPAGFAAACLARLAVPHAAHPAADDRP
jgi:tetraacyldisaccharide 4'-kinase